MEHVEAAPRRARPKPRSPRVTFTEVPKYWLGGSPAMTHVANGVNLLFPAGERFFVRAVRRYAEKIDDPDLRDRAKGFYGQEGRHAQMHERFFDALRGHGYPVDAILERYERVAYGVIEKIFPPILHLSTTAALEHFTAILAEDALSGPVLTVADPAMRRLLAWHAMEELEHKDVAFDVLARVNPSYAVRVAGLAIGAACLAGFWLDITRQLAAHDGMSLRQLAREVRRIEKRGHAPKPVARRVFLRGIREYLRRDFHPCDRDHETLVDEARRRLAEEGVIDASP